MNREIILMFLSLVIGGAIGFISSYFMWKTQTKYDKKNIALGFFIEISSLQKTLENYANLFEGGIPPPGCKADSAIEVRQPFYTDGLFFALRKEMSSFNRNLSERLFEFYSYVLEAEKARKIDSSDMFFQQANDAMKTCIIKANKSLPGLKELLKKEF